MTGQVAVAFGLCAVAFVGLGCAVAGLRSRVDSVSRRLDSVLADRAASTRPSYAVAPTPASAEDSAGRPDPAFADPGELSVAGAVERPVALITDMAHERPDEADLTVTRVVSVTLAGPFVKVAALSHGLRHALREESRMRIGYAVRRELKQQRKLRRRRSVRRAASSGWSS